jgi:hypothetical protein
MKELSIAVVTWNCRNFIERFVTELERSLRARDEYEVLICDNASTDGTADLLATSLPRHFRLVRSEENLGFARGNNLLIRQAKFGQIALLNPDVFDFPEDFWTIIEAEMAHVGADVGFVKLRNPDGSFQDCIGNFPSPTRAITSLIGKKIDFSTIGVATRVEVGIMAFMMTNKKVIDEIGLIDEDFHMYCEDVEWCFRATRAGKSIMYFPELSLTHLGGASAESRWKGLRKELIKYRSEGLFVRKHFHGIGFLLMMMINLLKRVIIRIRIICA